MQAGLGVAIQEKPLFLASALVEKNEATGGARRSHLGISRGHLHGFREPRPLTEITRGVEVRHARRMMRIGRALFVAQIQETVFLVEIGLVENQEELSQNIEVFDLLVVADPSVAET